MAHSQWNYWQ